MNSNLQAVKMESNLQAENKQTVQTSFDAMISILVFLDPKSFYKFRGVNSFTLMIFKKAFTKITKNSNLEWSIQLNFDLQIFELFKKSQIVNFVTQFNFNICGVDGLTYLPDILTVIYDKVKQDGKLLQDQGEITRVFLTNDALQLTFDNEFDKFEFSNKFKSFKIYITSQYQQVSSIKLTNQFIDYQVYDQMIRKLILNYPLKIFMIMV